MLLRYLLELPAQWSIIPASLQPCAAMPNLD
uniref:Uncharacterized protein n=1 Tax=Arundo donax TaxID=35708 RepID=A0A0A8ZSV5_ARUDO